MQNAPTHDTADADRRPVGCRADHVEPLHLDASPASSTAMQNVGVPQLTEVRRPGRVSTPLRAPHVAPVSVETAPAALTAVQSPAGTQATPAPLSSAKRVAAGDQVPE